MPPCALLLLLLCVQEAVSSECPTDCSCTSHESVFCVTRRSSTVPHVPSDTEQLYIFHNGISTLGPDDFKHLGQLQMLDLSQNQLSHIPDKAFEMLGKLKNLDLSTNQIRHIFKDSFSGLVQLERLYLYANQIQSIQMGAFESLQNLLELKLHENLLTSLPVLSFPRLLLLDLSNNNIPMLGPSDLQIPHLEALKVSSLGLTSLDANLMASLLNLHYLDISMNQFVEVPLALRQDNLNGLIRLNLAGNPLRELKLVDFHKLRGLHELDLSGLNLQSIPQGLLDNFPRLVQLTAAENPFNCLCPLAWFSVWLKEKGLNIGRPEETRCHFPLVNAGKMLSELEYKDFGCLDTTTALASTSSQSMSDLTTDKLQTNGTSNTIFPSSMAPSLSPHSTEQHCLLPCQNGGRCHMDQLGQRSCQCPMGATGLNCETKEETLKPWTTDIPMVVSISSRHVTATSILLDLHSFIQTQPHIRGIRLTYRNLSGPDHRPIILRVPASYPEYTLRGLRPNCTYSVCASPLVEKAQQRYNGSLEIVSCTEARTAGAPLNPLEPPLNTPGPKSGKIEPGLTALALLFGLALLLGTVVCVRQKIKRRRSKAEPEMEGVSSCSSEPNTQAGPEAGDTAPHLQSDTDPADSQQIHALPELSCENQSEGHPWGHPVVLAVGVMDYGLRVRQSGFSTDSAVDLCHGCGPVCFLNLIGGVGSALLLQQLWLHWLDFSCQKSYATLTKMQFLGRLLDTVSSVSTMFTNPYRVKDVPLADYSGTGRLQLKQEGRLVLYKNSSSQSWDCILQCPDMATVALRLFQVSSEQEAVSCFSQYCLKLRPFYETVTLKAENTQLIVDCIRSHPDWSTAHIAVETGQRECLKHNYVQSEINSQDRCGRTPLHLACAREDAGCVRELLEESQARTDLKDHSGDTAMHYAAKQDSPGVIQALCSQLCPGVNELNSNGESPLHVACRLGRLQAVKGLLEGGARCDIIGGSGYPIHTAMKYSEKECVMEILKADAGQLQAEDPVYGGIPIHWSKNAELCRLLLENGSSVNYLSKTGESPLHILTKKGRFEASMVLLTHGANPNIKGQNGDTALHLAMKMDHMELIKALIVFGADVEIHNDLGETPGLIAARSSKGFETMFQEKRTGNHNLHRVDTGKAGKRKLERLLSLDGGGIKGLVLIQILIALEKETGRPTRELFDWVAGTSTGGILALAIIHGKSMEYLRCLYFRMKEQVFKGSRPYESTPLEDFLKKEFGEETKMTDVKFPRVMVTSVLADRHPGELHMFRNYDPPSVPKESPYATTASFKPLTVPQEQLVWRAARSSGAAPTYFRPMGRFLDGGLLANNPTLDALVEIHQYNKSLKVAGEGDEVKKVGLVVSLGTGKPPQVSVSSVDVFRPSNPLELAKSIVGAKELGKMLVDCCTDSDGCAVDRARAWCEMTDTLYNRLSPQLSQEVMLDEVGDGVLVDMLWDTQMYLYEKRDVLQALAMELLGH
uniref:phospholipase A2 n=1 Tax=Knipowitschia caucasica TaxID=637954 RepID=A0AAV2LF26_KNICA